MENTTHTKQSEREAYELGVEHAKNAASWVIDNRSTHPTHYANVLTMMDDGDPAVYDYLPREPNLSGEYADDPTPQSLAADIMGADWETHGYNAPDFLSSELVDALADAYEAGVSDTFAPECERILREAIA